MLLSGENCFKVDCSIWKKDVLLNILFPVSLYTKKYWGIGWADKFELGCYEHSIFLKVVQQGGGPEL